MPRLRRVRWRVLACPVGWPFGKGDLEVIVVGIDPHKRTHTAVAVKETGEPVAEVTVTARLKGHERLLAWARELGGERKFAVEDCRHVSGNLERLLIARGERVVRVPPKLMAGARRSARTAGKSDGVDALAVAHAALREPDLPEAHLAGIERDIKQLLDHREDQVWERSRIQGRLRWHLHDIDPSFEIPLRALDRFCWLDRIEQRLAKEPASTAVRIALELVEDCRRITRRAKDLEKEVTALVNKHFPEMISIPGCGALSAAKLVGEIAGIERFASDAKLAMYAGVGPLEASSGNRQRHRLNRTGNRQLNAALHRIAVTQCRMYEPAQRFVVKKTQEGKSKREALRCLKRHLVRSIYRTLKGKSMPDISAENAAPELRPVAA